MYKQKAATYDMDQVVSCEVVGRWVERQKPSKITLLNNPLEPLSKTTLDIFLSEVRTG